MPAHLSSRPSGAQLAVHAWKSAAAATARMPVLMLSVVAASLLLGLATWYLAVNAAGAMHWPWPLARAVALMALKAAVVAPLAVAMHRFILLDAVTRGVLSFAPRHTWMFFGWTFAVQLFSLLLTQPSQLLLLQHGTSPSARLLGSLVILVSALVLWIVSIYPAMIFPAVATDVPSAGPLARIATSVRQMRGHFWQFIGGGVVSILPLLIPFFIVTLWLQRVMMQGALLHGMSHGALLSGAAGNWFLVICLIGGVETVVVVAVAAAVASWTYAALDLKD
jgi:hypothetical protein